MTRQCEVASILVTIEAREFLFSSMFAREGSNTCPCPADERHYSCRSIHIFTRLGWRKNADMQHDSARSVLEPPARLRLALTLVKLHRELHLRLLA